MLASRNQAPESSALSWKWKKYKDEKNKESRIEAPILKILKAKQ